MAPSPYDLSCWWDIKHNNTSTHDLSFADVVTKNIQMARETALHHNFTGGNVAAAYFMIIHVQS